MSSIIHFEPDVPPCAPSESDSDTLTRRAVMAGSATSQSAQCSAGMITPAWLHHIYSFLSFQDMHRASLTCQYWFTEAAKQPLRNVEFNLNRLYPHIYVRNFESRSPLLRHIVAITFTNENNPMTLSMLRSLTNLPNLRRLEACLEVDDGITEDIVWERMKKDEATGSAEDKALLLNQLQEIKSGALAPLKSCKLDIVVKGFGQDTVNIVIPWLVRIMPNLVEVDFKCRHNTGYDNYFREINFRDLTPLSQLRKLTVHQERNESRERSEKHDWKQDVLPAVRELPLTDIQQNMAWSKEDLEVFLKEPHNLGNLQSIDLHKTSFDTVDHVKVLEPVWSTLTSFQPLLGYIPLDAVPLLQNFRSLTTLTLRLAADADPDDVEHVKSPQSLTNLFTGGHFRLLTSLTLCLFMFDESDVQNIIDGCPMLDELLFDDCGFTAFPSLENATQLRRLQFYDALWCGDELADWIRRVNLDTFFTNITHCPHLRKLQFYGILGDGLSLARQELMEKKLQIQILVDFGGVDGRGLMGNQYLEKSAR